MWKVLNLSIFFRKSCSFRVFHRHSCFRVPSANFLCNCVCLCSGFFKLNQPRLELKFVNCKVYYLESRSKSSKDARRRRHGPSLIFALIFDFLFDRIFSVTRQARLYGGLSLVYHVAPDAGHRRPPPLPMLVQWNHPQRVVANARHAGLVGRAPEREWAGVPSAQVQDEAFQRRAVRATLTSLLCSAWLLACLRVTHNLR